MRDLNRQCLLVLVIGTLASPSTFAQPERAVAPRDPFAAMQTLSQEEKVVGLRSMAAQALLSDEQPDVNASALHEIARVARFWSLPELGLEIAQWASQTAIHPFNRIDIATTVADLQARLDRNEECNRTLDDALSLADLLSGTEAVKGARATVWLARARIAKRSGDSATAAAAREAIAADLPESWSPIERAGLFSNLARDQWVLGRAEEGSRSFERAAQHARDAGEMEIWASFRIEMFTKTTPERPARAWVDGVSEMLRNPEFRRTKNGFALATKWISRLGEAGFSLDEQIEQKQSILTLLRARWIEGPDEFRSEKAEGWLTLNFDLCLTLQASQRWEEALEVLDTALVDLAPYIGHTEIYQTSLQQVAASLESRLGRNPRPIERARR